MTLKKGDKFIDISGYQPADVRAIPSGTNKTIIKVSEGTGFLSSTRITQAQTSDVQGFYHFARFGGNVAQAQAEANFFINNIPSTGVRYLVCDYEENPSGDKQANTNAVLAFMDIIAGRGYKPIYYSYAPFTRANVYHDQINAKYPNSTWIAAYPNYAVTREPVWSIFPVMDGVRWYQFTSTYIAGGLDGNHVLIDDDETELLEKMEDENMTFTVGAKDRGIALLDGGNFLSMLDPNDPKAFWNAKVQHVSVSTKTFDEIQKNAANSQAAKTNELLDKLVKK